MTRDDDIDQRKLMKRGPSYGPDWDAAIDFGIDVTLLEDNLAMTMEERFIQSCKLTKHAEAMREAYEASHAGQ